MNTPVPSIVGDLGIAGGVVVFAMWLVWFGFIAWIIVQVILVIV